jgi:hypothetical protein
MDAERLKELAERCRELQRVAMHPEVQQQLREWEQDFEAEAEAEAEKRRVSTRRS